MAQCPVDHSGGSSSCSSDSQSKSHSSGDKCSVDHSQFTRSSEVDKCPVDHNARSTWSSLLGSITGNTSTSSPSPNVASPTRSTAHTTSSAPPSLPTAREVSSIPRADNPDTKWVYPSEAQFFSALTRKNHSPRPADMRVIVPIHNAVNEKAWEGVVDWERGWGGEKCGGVRLVSFKGRPGERTPKAWIKTVLGYQAPFDRHDWVIDRCGTKVRYVIDFYTGKSSGLGPSFYLDVRPALDNWDAVKMQTTRFLERCTGVEVPWRNATSTTSTTTSDASATSNHTSVGSEKAK